MVKLTKEQIKEIWGVSRFWYVIQSDKLSVSKEFLKQVEKLRN
jgi:hypothetical protein